MFLSLAVEEVEQVKGLDLELSDHDQDLQVSADRPQARRRLSKISTVLEDSMPGRLPLSLFDDILLLFIYFYPD